MKGIDDFAVLDVRDDFASITKTFRIILEAFILLLLDSLQGLTCRWTLICAL
jgi:hypothetical protein